MTSTDILGAIIIALLVIFGIAIIALQEWSNR